MQNGFIALSTKQAGGIEKVDLADPNGNPNCAYRFTAANGITYDPPAKGWRCTYENMRELEKAGAALLPQQVVTGRLSQKALPRRVQGHSCDQHLD